MSRQYRIPGKGALTQFPFGGYRVPGWAAVSSQESSSGAGTANGVTTVTGFGFAGVVGFGEADGLGTANGFGVNGASGFGEADGLGTAVAFAQAQAPGAGLAQGSTNVIGSGCELGSVYVEEIGNTNLYLEVDISCGAHPPFIFGYMVGVANGLTTVTGVVTPGDDEFLQLAAMA